MQDCILHSLPNDQHRHVASCRQPNACSQQQKSRRKKPFSVVGEAQLLSAVCYVLRNGGSMCWLCHGEFVMDGKPHSGDLEGGVQNASSLSTVWSFSPQGYSLCAEQWRQNQHSVCWTIPTGKGSSVDPSELVRASNTAGKRRGSLESHPSHLCWLVSEPRRSRSSSTLKRFR